MWFSKSKEDVLKELNVDPLIGLSEEEIRIRQGKYGPNILKKRKKKTVLQMFIAQLQDWLIYILFAAVVITLFMGEYIDAIIILLVIILNAVLGVVQEVKAGNAIEALQKMSSPRALVRRNGTIREVDSEDVVPGDILILDAGFIGADNVHRSKGFNGHQPFDDGVFFGHIGYADGKNYRHDGCKPLRYGCHSQRNRD